MLFETFMGRLHAASNLVTYLLTYLLIDLLHGAESFFRS